MQFNFFVFFLFLCVASFFGCNNNKAEETLTSVKQEKSFKLPDLTIPGSFIDQSNLSFDSVEIIRFIDSFSSFQPISAELYSFYKKRNFTYAWFDQTGITEPAQHLYNSVINIESEGLPDKILYKQQFIELMENVEWDKNKKVFLEIMLTAQYLSYSKLAWMGMSKQQLSAINWHLPRKESSYKSLLDSLLNGKDLIDNIPVYYQYALLKDKLKVYNQIHSEGGWGFSATISKTLKLGDTSSIVSKVKKRLSLTSEYKVDNYDVYFDSTLEKSIKLFQHSIGLKETGWITTSLIHSLNIPVEKRIQDIIVNMERCRWLPVNLGNAYLLINIPEYRLHLFENGQKKWDMKIVVGKNNNRTAIFSGEIKYVVFCPYWNVPSSILKKEILPAIKKNPGYLQRHHMEWHDGGVRQLPGNDNALGLVKFLFPNSHSIYLHDTPSKSLFGEDKRAFSHGCIRLQEPFKLSAYLLKNEAQWDENRIAEVIKTGKERYVTLSNPIPVYITYLTSWVDENNQLQFRDDVYELNEKLLKMILDKPVL